MRVCVSACGRADTNSRCCCSCDHHCTLTAHTLHTHCTHTAHTLHTRAQGLMERFERTSSGSGFLGGFDLGGLFKK
jgi:hypothetical protein